MKTLAIKRFPAATIVFLASVLCTTGAPADVISLHCDTLPGGTLPPSGPFSLTIDTSANTVSLSSDVTSSIYPDYSAPAKVEQGSIYWRICDSVYANSPASTGLCPHIVPGLQPDNTVVDYTLNRYSGRILVAFSWASQGRGMQYPATCTAAQQRQF